MQVRVILSAIYVGSGALKPATPILLVRTEEALQEVAIPATSCKFIFHSMIALKQHIGALQNHINTIRCWKFPPRSPALSLSRSTRTLCLCVRVKKREQRAPGRDGLPPTDHLPGSQREAD